MVSMMPQSLLASGNAEWRKRITALAAAVRPSNCALARRNRGPDLSAFSDFDVVEPDLLYMSNARAAEILTAQHVKGSPDLVIEIGSPSTRVRDETIKRRLYKRSTAKVFP